MNAPAMRAFRANFLFGFLLCVAVLGYVIWTQFRPVAPLEPCPLCIFQRVAYAALAVAFLLGAIFAPRSRGARRAWGIVAFLVAAGGMWIAGRHVWIQHLPADQVPACGAPLDVMLANNAFGEVVRKVMTGSGECAKVDWTLLGLSMPEWSLAGLVVLGLWALWAGWRR